MLKLTNVIFRLNSANTDKVTSCWYDALPLTTILLNIIFPQGPVYEFADVSIIGKVREHLCTACLMLICIK